MEILKTVILQNVMDTIHLDLVLLVRFPFISTWVPEDCAKDLGLGVGGEGRVVTFTFFSQQNIVRTPDCSFLA